MSDAGLETSIDESGKIPAKAFLGNPLFSLVRLSPSGRKIAVVMSRGDRDAVASIDLGTGERAPLGFLQRSESSSGAASTAVENLAWGSEDFVILQASRTNPRPGARARKFMLFTSSVIKPRVELLGEPLGNERLINPLPDNPRRYLVNSRGWARHADLKSGTMRRVVARKNGIGAWGTDHEFKIRVGLSENEYDTKHEVWGRVSEEDRLQKLVEWDPLSVDEVGPGFFFRGFSEKPHIIYVTSERETGRFAIYEYDLRTQELGAVVFEHPKYGVSGLRTSRIDGRLLSVSYIEDRPVTKFIDSEYRELWEPIHRKFQGKTIYRVSTDRNERLSIFAVSADDSPPVYYKLDHLSGDHSRLFKAWPDLDGQPLSKMEPIRFQSRDGLEIHGYVTRPVRANGPTATIVFPHNGPLARNYQRWDPYVQFLASRGFTVFQLNHRGSVGYGREFREAGYKELGRGIQNDISDGVQWLIEQGIADPTRIGIFGIGYGGYAALHGLTSTPELYAAGASYAGFSDIVALLDDDNLAYYGIDAVNKALIGSRWTDRSYLREVSPSYHADQIKVPVLLGHGTHDWNFHIRHTDRMTSALESAEVDHEVYRYRGESHEFLDERTRIDFFRKVAAFFEKHLRPDPEHIRRPVAAAAPQGI